MKRRSVIVASSSVVPLAGCVANEKPTELDDTDGGEPTPTDGGDDEWIQAKGDLQIVVDGSPIDLTEDRFQAENVEDESLAFHLHEGDEYWYMEGFQRVTFAEAIDLLPYFEYTPEDGDHVVTFDGTVYDGTDPGTTITFAVDGEAVAPTDYELQDGDDLLVEISTDE